MSERETILSDNCLTLSSLQDATRLLHLCELTLCRALESKSHSDFPVVVKDLRRVQLRILYHLQHCSQCQELDPGLLQRQSLLQRQLRGPA